MQIVMHSLLLLPTEKKIIVYVAADKFRVDTRGNGITNRRMKIMYPRFPEGDRSFPSRFLKAMVDNDVS